MSRSIAAEVSSKMVAETSVLSLSGEIMYKPSSIPSEIAAVDNIVFFLLLRTESFTT